MLKQPWKTNVVSAVGECVRYQDWKGWNGDSFGVCSPASGLYFSSELRCSGVAGVAGCTILEIGFGNGEFARWSLDSGAKYIGTELIGDLIEQAQRAGFVVRDAKEPLDGFLAEQSIDLVVAFDVFEHFEADALRSALHSAHRALRPSGRVIARVPSGDSPFSGAIQHGDATHCLVIGSSMVHQLANETGFTVHCTREPAFPLYGLGAKAFLRRALVRCVRFITFPLLAHAFMGGGRPVLTPNMVFVLVKS
jgi:SAM-dependent methyltransferase